MITGTQATFFFFYYYYFVARVMVIVEWHEQNKHTLTGWIVFFQTYALKDPSLYLYVLSQK